MSRLRLGQWIALAAIFAAIALLTVPAEAHELVGRGVAFIAGAASVVAAFQLDGRRRTRVDDPPPALPASNGHRKA